MARQKKQLTEEKVALRDLIEQVKKSSLYNPKREQEGWETTYNAQEHLSNVADDADRRVTAEIAVSMAVALLELGAELMKDEEEGE